ncbi:MAG TPA: glycosyltransferase family 39 protein, partial [Vicinamibacteria bacterium]
MAPTEALPPPNELTRRDDTLVRRLAPVTWMAVAFALLATLWSAWDNDWTTDEPMHLEWSRRLMDQGRTERLSKLHFNSKTPVTVLNQAARRFARGVIHVRDPRAARLAARAPGLLWLGVVLGATFLLARRCAGPVAAHLATLAVALDPNLIANSSIATVDTAYAAATLLTVAAALSFTERPGVAAGAALGLALGLAFSIKFTAFLLIPAVLLLPLGAPEGGSRLWAARRPAVAGAAVALGTSVAFVCASYLFIQVGVPIGQVPWRS